MTAIAASSRCIPTWCWAWTMPLFRGNPGRGERRQGRRAGHRSGCRRPQAHRRPLQGARGKGTGQAVPGRRAGAAVGRHRRGVRLLAQPARQHLSQAEQYSGRLGHGGHGAGHGVRQSRRDLGHRRRLHPRSGHRRKAALRRIPDQRPGRRRGGGHPHAAADLQRSCASARAASKPRWKKRCPRRLPN